jgi:hypothetical protein
MPKDKNYREAYKKLIKELNFQELQVVRKDFNEGVFLLTGQINKKPVFFKIFPLFDKRRLEGIRKEVKVDKIIKKHNEMRTSVFIDRTEILNYGNNKDFNWLIRTFYQGETLGQIKSSLENAIFADKLSVIRREFLLNRDNIINQIAKNIFDFRTINYSDEFLFSRRYKSNIEEYDIGTVEEALNIKLKNQLFFYKFNKIQYFRKSNINACIGDLTTTNILIKNNGDLFFSDFEWFSFDNQMMDIAFLWLYLWRYPDWQHIFLKHFIEEQKDKFNFRASIIRILTDLFNLKFDKKIILNDKILGVRKAYKNHIWAKYLIAAGNSFETIINTHEV